MTTDTAVQSATEESRTDGWYAASAEEVTSRIGVDPSMGLSGHEAVDLLERNGTSALPAEKAIPGWRRFVEQYRSYTQLILVGAAIVSLAIKEWSTGVLLILITVLNAAVSLRQEGKAESAMNALKANRPSRRFELARAQGRGSARWPLFRGS